MQIYKYVQSDINILPRLVSVTSVNILIRVFYNKNTINMQ
jgi:hypothetical protein